MKCFSDLATQLTMSNERIFFRSVHWVLLQDHNLVISKHDSQNNRISNETEYVVTACISMALLSRSVSIMEKVGLVIILFMLICECFCQISDCNDNGDVIVLLDASGSLGNANFELAKSFLQEMGEYYFMTNSVCFKQEEVCS